MNKSLPSYNPADLKTATGAFKELFSIFSKNLECCIPAIVVSYDRAKHTAVVQPAINIVMTRGEIVERAQIAATVWRFMCGGFLVDLPISAGDTGWLIAGDKESSLFKASGKASAPNTFDSHQYADGFFIPDKFGEITLAAEDAGRLVLQNAAGTEKISIGESDTKITSAALTISAATVTITGDLDVNGTVTGDTDVVTGAISLLNHTHGGVTAGAASTGVPQ